MKLLNAILGILFDLIGYIVDTLFDFALSAVPTKRKHGYDADFTKPEKVLQKNGGGFMISTWSTSMKESHEHLVCFGGSGSFKSSAVAYPTCLNADNVSLVIHDPKRELIRTAGAFQKKGYTIQVIDYNNPQASEGFNGLAKSNSTSDLFRISHILHRNALEHSSDDFWIKSSENLVSLFERYLVEYGKDKRYATIPNVLEMVNRFAYAPESIDTLMAGTSSQMINEYKAIVALPPNTLLGIIASAKAALQIYSSPNIQQLTSFDSVDFERFRKEKTVLFLCSSAGDASLYRGISACFFEMLWNYLLRAEPQKNDLSLFLIIEECASMHLSSLSSAISLLRAFRCSIALFLQDYNQLEHEYGRYEAANIVSNCATKIFMPGAKSLETCKMLETMLGKYTYTEDGKTSVRELLTSQEIRQLKEILVLSKNRSPLLLPVRPYFEQPRFRKMMQNPPYVVPDKSLGQVPLLQFS
jgi:type IV secretion system protein VirD4